MKYKIGMSDRKTRGNQGRKKNYGLNNFSISTRNLSSFKPSASQRRSTTNSRSTTVKKASSGSRSGFRKFSKLGVTAKALSSSGNKRRKKNQSPSSTNNRKSKIKAVAKKSIIGIVIIGFAVGVISVLGMGLYLKSLENSLPDPNKLIARSSDQSTVLFDRNGEELFKIYGDENRQFVPIDDIPDHTKWALLAAEDVEFYQHKGLDWKGIIRCGLISVRSYSSDGESGGVCGASTITQQLVRNTLMYDVFGDEAFERSTLYKTIRRKLRELLLSMQVEQTLTKDEILQLYMNEINLGGVNYGYEAASQSYFGKSVKELDLAESAMLAGIIQQPSILSPIYGINPEGAPARQGYVLDQMLKYKNLTGVSEDEITAAREQELIYSSGNIDIEAYHFVFYIKKILEEEYGAEVVERGGLKVTTSLDLSTQKIAQEEVTAGVQSIGHPLGVYNGAMVVLDPNTGQILAMVGSVDPNITDDPRIDGNVNITTSMRQVGSSFKPYVYLTAFQQYGPWLLAPDIPMEFGNYKPTNWDERYYGLMTAREALLKSRNIPANYTMQTVGIDPVIETAEKVGITTLTDRQNYGLSLALGAAEMKLLEHAQGFSVFATGGVKRDATGILKVEDSKGEVLYEFEPTQGERVFDEKDIYMLNWVLCDLGGFGDQPFNNQYFIGGKRAVCGKTGTTNGPKDLVSIQYHKNIVVAMWAGNNNGEEVPGAWSTTVPLPIVHSFMERVSSKYVPELPTRPSGILAGTVCNDTGRAADKDTNCTKVPTIYVQGRAPAKDTRESFFLCKVNDKTPSNLEEAKQIKDGNGDFSLLEKATLLNFTLENTQQQGSYEKYLEKEGKVFTKKPEEAYCEVPLGPNNAPIITLSSPEQGQTYSVGDVISIRATARAEGGIDFVRFSFAGSQIGSEISGSPFEMTYTVPGDAPDGTVLISARVVDDQGRVGTDAISVTIDNPAAIGSVTLNDPGEGAIISKPVNVQLKAKVNGFEPNDVIFSVTGPGYFWSEYGWENGSNWVVNWSEGGVSNGSYTIEVDADGYTDSVTVQVGN